MPYGTIKVDNITFDNGGSDQNVTASGLYRATTSGVTVTGTVAAAIISGVTVIGSTTVSGATVTGTTANFTSGNFGNLISSAATMSGALVMANQQQVRFRETVGNGTNHIAVQAPAAISTDQTITLPDQTGTLITTGDNGSVSSAMLTTNLTISAAAGSAAAPSIAFTGDSNTGIYSPGADTIAFTEGGAEAMRIDSSGRLLVGTSTARSIVDTSTTQFETVVDSFSQGVSFLNHSVGGFYPNLRLALSRTNTQGGQGALNVGTGAGAISFAGSDGVTFRETASITAAADAAWASGDTPGRLLFATTPSGSALPVERMRIDSSGRVLVGTSTARTDFYGSNVIRPQVQIETANTVTRCLSIVSSASVDAGGLLVLAAQKSGAVGGNTTVTLGNELGQIGFLGSDGTTMQPGALIQCIVDNTPSTNIMPARLAFVTATSGGTLTPRMVIMSDGITNLFGASGDVLAVRSPSNAGTGNYTIRCTYGASGALDGTVSFQVATNGNVTNTNSSYGAISDLKLKENIVDANSQWDDLKALQVRNYNLKEGQTHTQIGLIAQEVELVSPGLVNESPDRDEEGNDLGTVTKSVAYSVLYMKAVKALQEAMERIEVLEAKVTVLEAA